MSNRYGFSKKRLDLSPDIYYILVYKDTTWNEYVWTGAQLSLRDAVKNKMELIAAGAKDVRIVEEAHTYLVTEY